MNKTNLKIRPPKPTDLNFILSTFMKSMKRESHLGRQCSVRVFFNEFQKVADSIISRSSILISCVEENEHTIIGYLIYEPDAIHYAYVRPTCRRYDVAKEMIGYAFPDAKSLTFTLSTNDSKEICEKHPELIFNPFLLFRKETPSGND